MKIKYTIAIFGVLFLILLFTGCTSTSPPVQAPTPVPTTAVAILSPTPTPTPTAVPLSERSGAGTIRNIRQCGYDRPGHDLWV